MNIMNQEELDRLRERVGYLIVHGNDNTDKEYHELYNLLLKDHDATLIRYREMGVKYLCSAVKTNLRTLVKILLLRTTRSQHDEAYALLDDFDKGFLIECKRENIDQAQYNRGALLFLKTAKVPFEIFVKEFQSLPLEKQVISLKHATGDIDPPSEAYVNLLKTLESGYSQERSSDLEQHGHDHCTRLKIDLEFRKALMSQCTFSKSALMLLVFNHFNTV
jgi:hypothetical protein